MSRCKQQHRKRHPPSSTCSSRCADAAPCGNGAEARRWTAGSHAAGSRSGQPTSARAKAHSIDDTRREHEVRCVNDRRGADAGRGRTARPARADRAAASVRQRERPLGQDYKMLASNKGAAESIRQTLMRDPCQPPGCLEVHVGLTPG
jgi:hypothetical protein